MRLPGFRSLFGVRSPSAPVPAQVDTVKSEPSSKVFVDYDPKPFEAGANRVELFAFYTPVQHKPANHQAPRPHDPPTPLLTGWSDDPTALANEIELALHYGVTGFVVEYAHAGDKAESTNLLSDLCKACPDSFYFCASLLIPVEASVTEMLSGLLHEVHQYFSHPRYARYVDRPIVVIESAKPPSEFAAFVRSLGDDRPYLIYGALSDLTEDARESGFDAPVQLAVHTIRTTQFPPSEIWTGPESERSSKKIYSYASVKRATLNRPIKDYAEFEALYVGWNSETVAYRYPTHQLYQQWLDANCKRAIRKTRLNVPLVFVKSWNDWAHECAIAPDRRYGYKRLRATRSALASGGREAEQTDIPRDISAYAYPSDGFEGIPVNPVLVFQMGCVGSTAVTSALENSNYPDKIVHTHCLDRLDERIHQALVELPDPARSVREFMRGKVIRNWMDRSTENTRWNIVTIVRDPVARNISGFVNGIHAYVPDIAERIENNDLQVEELQYLFLAIAFSTKFCDWYREFLEPVFPFQLEKIPYTPGRGYAIAEQLPYRLIVFRNEDLGKSLAPGLSEFLGIDEVKISAVNRTEEKKFGDLYKQFQTLSWPKEYVDAMYDDPIIRRFYSEEEIEGRRKRYLSGS